MRSDQIPALPGRKRRQMPGICPGGGDVEASIWLVRYFSFCILISRTLLKITLSDGGLLLKSVCILLLSVWQTLCIHGYCVIANEQVTYQCVHTARPEYLLRICEGLSRTIHCYGGKKINIIEANYGRLAGGQICPGQIKTTYCGAARSQAKVRTACQAKSQCVLKATNSIYGEPCKGTRKYLEVRIIQLKIVLL